MTEATITNEQKISVSVTPVTAVGNPAPLDGAIIVTVQSGDGTVEMIDDRSFFAVSGPNPGDTTYLIEADADIGAGVQTISDIFQLHVEGALATSLGVSVGTAVPK